MLVFLMLAGCAATEATDYRGGWKALPCVPLLGDDGWYLELEATGDPRPTYAVYMLEGGESWRTTFPSRWESAEQTQTITIGASSVDVAECRAWVAE